MPASGIRKHTLTIFILILWLIILSQIYSSPVNAFPSNHTQNETIQQSQDDLSSIRLTQADLPEGFTPLPENQMAMMTRMMEGILSSLEGASLINLSGFSLAEGDDVQIVVSGVIHPLSQAEKFQVDAQLKNPAAMQDLAENMGGENFVEIPDAKDLGNAGFGFSLVVSQFQIDYIVIRRSEILIELTYLYRPEQEPRVKALGIMAVLDQRAIAVLGTDQQAAFRPAGLLAPEITTYIPTPADLSTDPAVIGSNLFLAAMMMVPFAIATELLTRTLIRHDKGWFGKISAFRIITEKFAGDAQGTGERPRKTLLAFIQPFAVILLYGLVFSLLDRTWKPLTLTGVMLFISMTAAYGMVGLLDDLLQWTRLRHWRIPARLSVMPTNFMLSAISVAATRIFRLTPGLMFGTPKALTMDKTALTDVQRKKLLTLSTSTIVGLGIILWCFTLLTSWLQRLALPLPLWHLTGGVEAFCLIVFAVSLENIFIQFLGFQDSVGEVLRKKNRILWLAVLVFLTFILYHSLINPRGELADALKSGNVQVFFAATMAYILFVLGIWLFNRSRNRKQGIKTPLQADLGSIPESHLECGGGTGMPAAVPETLAHQLADRVMPVVSIYTPGGEKHCPACSYEIKAEARICRFCRKQFEIHLRGYCLHDHQVVNVTDRGLCLLCGGAVEDIHVESKPIAD